MKENQTNPAPDYIGGQPPKEPKSHCKLCYGRGKVRRVLGFKRTPSGKKEVQTREVPCLCLLRKPQRLKPRVGR